MKKIEVKKTKPKIILLVVGMNVFSILLVLTILLYITNIKKSILDNYNNQFQDEITRITQLGFNQIVASMERNDLVDYLKTKDSSLYNEMYADPSFFKSDYIGVYGLDNKIINHTNSTKIKEVDFVPKEALLALNKLGKSRFYLKTSDGIIQVFGITIAKSNGTINQKPVGYFIVARKIDSSFKQSVEKITNSTITVFNNQKSKVTKNYILQYKVDLKDYKNQFVARVYFERPFEKFIATILKSLYFILFVSLLLLLFSFIYTEKWISVPLNAITKALETGNKESIEILKNTEGDFKNIGTLFEENAKQKSKLVKAKLKAEESDKLKSSFLSNLSHEIRTPMNAIVGFTELLMNTDLEEEEKQEYLSVIDKSGKNLIAIIDDLIEMSKIESDQTKPNYAAVNMESCIKDLYDSIKITNKRAKKIDFKLIESKKPAPFPVKTDEVKLKQIITNLVTNALKFTEQGSVELGYEIDEPNNKIVFKIKDTGFGIDENNQQYIFDRFRRVGGDHTVKIGGLGLGLAISKAYAEMLGGTITLESKLGKGSEFYFTIPLEYVKSQRISVQPVNELTIFKGEEKGTILIAEDDNINFLLFQKIMKGKNFRIIRAENGQEAVDICFNNPNIDLVLMDIKMPIMDGFEALEKIMPIRPNLPIIAQTAFASNEDKDRIFRAGFTDYITKPINRERLFETIEVILKKKVS
ncbi:signal transduction histidine kinase [Flavobacterium sp. 103]|uniref:ATP-binding protein n=1 Tax=unclassified Flavobacterium TaxID=196869 RepID=UPI000D5C8C52|nr:MULTISPECIES: ATP-binding protein [unclassified Flavobacterium]PVX44760.1 signal transduction histidine kinase [Flavobacterium sp. 103]QKJ63093.1 response regulator [Flavobacterium sp. M31R6]